MTYQLQWISNAVLKYTLTLCEIRNLIKTLHIYSICVFRSLVDFGFGREYSLENLRRELNTILPIREFTVGRLLMLLKDRTYVLKKADAAKGTFHSLT